MPFKKGPAAWRRTLEYLNSGTLVFKEKVKVCAVHYHEKEASSEGLRRFVFWHMAQIQHKNPGVQCVQLKNIVPTPFIAFHTWSERENRSDSLAINCYKRSEHEIMEQCRWLVGKSDAQIRLEAQINEANFGDGCQRHCICVVEGQVACPRMKPLPHFMRGKYYYIKKDELDEIRKTKPDEQALHEYWNTK